MDCAGVEQADITFVQTLMAASRSCAARDLPFALTGMSDVVASAFHRAGVTP
ncbi:MAG: anti-anti-sigma factor, partial [Bosea sp. 32-68-6]